MPLNSQVKGIQVVIVKRLTTNRTKILKNKLRKSFLECFLSKFNKKNH